MTSRGVHTLKFVGTVSLGLLTGLSYTLSTLTVPTLLTLPSATTASRAFKNLTTTARSHVGALAGVSSAAFLLAYALSPRAFRHPYLLYTSIIVASSRLAVSDAVAPYLLTKPQPSDSSPPPARPARKSRSPATRRMEMSYDVIGSDAHSDASLDSASDHSLEDDSPAVPPSDVNGEEVRGEVEWFLKKNTVSTAISGLGFVMAVVGIWGDGALTFVTEQRVDIYI